MPKDKRECVMGKAKYWYAFWNVLRYGTFIVAMVNTVVLLGQGNPFFIALSGNQLGALMWMIYFISKFVLSVTKEYLNTPKSDVSKQASPTGSQSNTVQNNAEEDSKQQKTE